MRRVPLGGAEIEYSERGRGEPILLVHGGVFADWFLPLSASSTLDGFRVIRVRRAGYGPNAPELHLSLADHAGHLAALADLLGLRKIHWVGHSSSCLIGLQQAIDRPDLVHSLVLLEPAPGGGLQAPAFAELGRQFVGPAMEAFAAGEVERAFDTFLRGVGGGGHRELIERTLGQAGYERAVREAAFFFADEIPAVQEWRFGAAEAGRVHQPVLVAEGGESARLGPMSRQITELATSLLSHAEVATIAGVNHMLPLQDPDAVGRVIATFVRRHPTNS